jgi:hypothetical protein
MKEYWGPYEVNEIGMGLTGDDPTLTVNGNVILPVANEATDVTLDIGADSQRWRLIKEYTPWRDVNRLGYYTDLDIGNVQFLIFTGANGEGFTRNTSIMSGTEIGLWLLNDTNGDSIYNSNDSYLFSERHLTRGSGAHEYQWFMVFDVHSYKYTGATYHFDCNTEDFTFSGDFDYLVFTDDDHTSSNFDHNDLVFGVTCNRPPVANCPGDQTVAVCNLGPVSIPGFSASDPDGNLSSTSVNVGTLNSGVVTFTPSGPGVVQIRLIATDSWGVADTCFTNVNVIVNSRPDAVSPANQAIFACNLNQICLPGFTATDPDGNLVSKILQGGVLSGDTACFTPVSGANILKLIATDACGLADTSITVVTVNLNSRPDAVSPANQSLFVCNLSQICIPGFTASDPDGNLISTVVVGGTLHGDTACFTPISGPNTLRLIATDACGKADTSTTVVTVSVNQPPVAVSPSNHARFACDTSPICIPGFSATDPDGNLTTRILQGGTLSGDTACFNPVEGNNTLTLIATDACGAADTSLTVVTVSINDAPVASSPANQNMFVCNLDQICLPGFTATDADGNLVSRVLQGGVLHGDTACFTPVMGSNTFTFIATDACGAADTSITIVDVAQNQAPMADAPANQMMFVCNLTQICLPGFTSSDPDGNIATRVLQGGTLNGDTACFTPVAGPNTLRLIVTDVCGLADTATSVVTIAVNVPPVAVTPADQNMFVCDLSQVCLPGFSASDPDGNLATRVLLGGTLNGDTACFVPVIGTNTLTLIATDACGAADTSATVVTISVNNAPVALAHVDTSYFLCSLTQICLPGFSASDVDNNLSSVALLGGTLHGDTACFTPVAGVNVLRLVATDACGAADTSVASITVALNGSPLAVSPADTTLLLFDLSPVCLPGFTASDPDGNLVSRVILGGTLSGDTVCFTPVLGVNTLTLIATDACGVADTSITHVTINIEISLAVAGGTLPIFTEEIPDSFYIALTGGDIGSLVFSTDFTTHSGAPVRYTTSFDGSNFKVVVTFDYLGEFSSAQSPFDYRVIATDSYSADTLDLSLVVIDNNRIPAVSSINDTTVFVGSTLAFGVTGNDLDTDNTLTLAKTNGPGVFVSSPGAPPVNGTFSWSPVTGDIGSHEVIFSVNDGRGGNAVDTVNILVWPTGINLSVVGGSAPIFIEEVADSFLVELGGFDPGSISFASSFPGHTGVPARYSTAMLGSQIKAIVTFDFLGEFSNAQSPFAYRLIASDDFTTDTLNLSLVVDDNNRPPWITVGSNYTVIADHPINFMVTADDFDTDNTLNLVKVSGPGSFAGASGTPPISNIFSWTPSDADVPGSPYTVRFATGDGRGGVDTANVTITVYAEGLPTINLVHSPAVFRENVLDSVVFTAADPEGDPLGGFGFKFLSPDSSFAGASFAVRNDTAYLRLTFDYLGAWSSANSPFSLRLMGYAMIADADSAYLNISLTVQNANRKPELQVTGAHIIEAGTTLSLDLLALDLDTDDVITLTGSNLPLGSSLLDNGDRTGDFTWATSTADTGMYSFRFYADDNRGETNSRDTVIWNLQVAPADTGGGPDDIGLVIGCPSAVPGSDVLVPVYLHTPDFYTGGFEVLIGWDPTALTLLDAIPTVRANNGSEYFNVNNGDSGPGTARTVWIADINDGVHTSPMDPGHDAIMWLNFHVAPGEFLFGVSVPIEFLVRHYSDNTISDSTGYILVWPLLTSGCVYIEDPNSFAGDPNMNCYPYEIADAVLVAQRLIEGYVVWAADDFMANDPLNPPPFGCSRHAFGNDPMQEASSDLNSNGFADIADLVSFINIINGLIFPPKLDPVSGTAQITMPAQYDSHVDVKISCGYEVGGALVRIQHKGVTIGDPIRAEGMDVLSFERDGVLTVIVYSIVGNRIASGTHTLFTLPVEGLGDLSFDDASVSDCFGRLIDATARLEAPLPTETELRQNYPNPFNPSTSFSLALAAGSNVQLDIYDITGRKVRALVSTRLEAGYHNIVWDGRNDRGGDVSSGIYFARLTSAEYCNTIKMSLVR